MNPPISNPAQCAKEQCQQSPDYQIIGDRNFLPLIRRWPGESDDIVSGRADNGRFDPHIAINHRY
jgi:hypothetical protein